MIEPGSLRAMRQAQVISSDAADAFHAVAGDENVQPAIVVVVEEPCRETERRGAHIELLRHVSELPFPFG